MKYLAYTCRSLALTGALAAACASNVKDTGSNTETNWFSVCAKDSDCSTGLQCLCARCTAPCESNAGCSGAPQGATCQGLDTIEGCQVPSGAGNDRACVVGCESDDDCAEGRCLDGLCASATAPGVDNPTGDCEAPDDGGRAGYHSPASGDTWLPDCDNTLSREYYRVFAQSDGTAYIIPRPDGAFWLIDACSNPDHPLAGVVERYALCEGATSPGAAEVVNHIDLADAFALTHHMHTLLLFRPSESGLETAPMPTDVLDACALRPDERSDALVTICEDERARLEGGGEYGIDYSRAAEELAMRLNELYGITCTPGELPGFWCSCGPADGCATAHRECRPACASQAECSSDTQCRDGACMPPLCG